MITRATGHTGNIAARTLLSRGQKVRVLGRSTDRLASLASAGAEPFADNFVPAFQRQFTAA